MTTKPPPQAFDRTDPPSEGSPVSPAGTESLARPVAGGHRSALPRRSVWPWWVALAVLGILFLAVWAAFNGQRLTGSGTRMTIANGGRVALLPWVNATGDPAFDWTSIGLMEVAAQAISETPEIEMVPVRWVEQALRRRRLDVADEGARQRARELAVALGASLVLETTLRRGDDEDVRLETTLWREDVVEAAATYKGREIMEAAEQLADGVARGLNPDALRVTFARLLSGDSFADQLFAMGLDALRAGRVAEGESYFDIAVRHRPRFLLARSRLAECAVARGELSQAREGFVAVLEEAQSRGDRYLQAASLLSLSDVAARGGADDEADELARQAEAIYLALGDRARQLETLDIRSRIALAGRRSARAEALFIEILQAQRALENRLGEIDTLRQLGSTSLANGDIEAAADLLGEARVEAQALGDVASEMNIAASLGEVAARQGRIEDADDLWSEATAHYRQRNDQARTLLLAEKRARLLWSDKSYERAEDLYLDVQELAVVLGDEASEGRAALALADILLRKGYPYQARPQLDRALALDRLIDDPLAIQRVIARFAHAQGSHGVAVDTLRAVRDQAGTSWTEDDAKLLARYERARLDAEHDPES